MGQVIVDGNIFHLVVISVHNKNIFKITQLGSNWNNGSNAGSFYWNLNNSVGNRNRNIGSQLVNAFNSSKIEISKAVAPVFIQSELSDPATWQNTKVLISNQAQREVVLVGHSVL